MDALYQIELFEGITEQELKWLTANSQDRWLQTGDYFLKEQEESHEFYIVLEGEMQVTQTTNGQTVVLGTTPRGIIGGELPLLNGTLSQTASCAIMPTRLMIFSVQAFRRLFAECPTVGARILKIATSRMANNASSAKQQEKLSALGKLSAGLAHELNNPAAAARRAAKTLRELQPELQIETMKLETSGLGDMMLGSLAAFPADMIAAAADTPPLGPMDQSDREDQINGWLEERGIADAWDMASTFVSANVTVEQLNTLVVQFPPAGVNPMLNWLCKALEVATLLDEIEQSTRRISDLVAAIKEYTFMDRSERQEVDLHRGLDNTLKILNHKLKNIKVVREYDTSLPKVWGNGGELNQVWTNLIDNAIDAMNGKDGKDGRSGGTLRLITRHENAYAMVEINDDGPGIPPDTLPRIWEPFFTTKDVGAGTGLGLDTTYRIIRQHGATIEVQSRPGETRFIVRLPVGKPPEESSASS